MACNISEEFVGLLGHEGSEATGEATDLFMDVPQECLGLPSALLLDDGVVNSIEVQGHGSPCSKGVAADLFSPEAIFRLEESNHFSALFDRSVDVCVVDVGD
ncbi:MAG TPA: hypothetical protein V6D20_13565 [Candidatus Obscuribacterales bacterium]